MDTHEVVFSPKAAQADLFPYLLSQENAYG